MLLHSPNSPVSAKVMAIELAVVVIASVQLVTAKSIFAT